MSLSSLLLAIFLVLFALNIMGVAAVMPIIIAIFALAAAVALVVEGLGVNTVFIRRS